MLRQQFLLGQQDLLHHWEFTVLRLCGQKLLRQHELHEHRNLLQQHGLLWLEHEVRVRQVRAFAQLRKLGGRRA